MNLTSAISGPCQWKSGRLVSSVAGYINLPHFISIPLTTRLATLAWLGVTQTLKVCFIIIGLKKNVYLTCRLLSYQAVSIMKLIVLIAAVAMLAISNTIAYPTESSNCDEPVCPPSWHWHCNAANLKWYEDVSIVLLAYEVVIINEVRSMYSSIQKYYRPDISICIIHSSV